MSYEPTTWKDGDLVTSAKLNKIEQGIAAGGGVLVVHTNDEGVLDKTWQEIHDADVCFLSTSNESIKQFAYIVMIRQGDDNTYIVYFFSPNGDNPITFISSSPDDYPTIREEQQGNVR